MLNPDLYTTADRLRDLPFSPYVVADIENADMIDIITIYRENIESRDELYEASMTEQMGCPAALSQTEYELHLLETFVEQGGMVNQIDAAMDIVNRTPDASLSDEYLKAWDTFTGSLGLVVKFVEPPQAD